MTATIPTPSLRDDTAPAAPPPTRPRQRRTLARLVRPVALRLVVPAVVLAVWWFVTAREMVSVLIVPPPDAVWQSLNDYLFSGLWNEHVAATVRGTLLSVLLGLALGVGIGSLLAFVGAVKAATYPYILAFQAFPKIAVAPLFVVWLGYGDAPKVIIGASIAFFPVVSATMAGLADVDPDEHALMRSIGAGRLQELRHLRLPRAMSYIFPSLDVAVVGALLGVITVEIVGTEFGLGRVIAERSSYGDSPAVYAVLVILALLGAVLHAVVAVTRRVLPRSISPR